MGARRDGAGVLVAPADGGSRPTADATGEGHRVPGLHDEAGQRLLNDGRNLKPRVTSNLQSVNQPINQSLTCETYTLGQWQSAIIHPTKQRYCSAVKCGKHFLIFKYVQKLSTGLGLDIQKGFISLTCTEVEQHCMKNSAPRVTLNRKFSSKVTLPVKFPEQRCKAAISLKQQLKV